MIKKKIKTISSLKKIIASLKKNGKKIVFTNGCFDIIHSGHALYLEEAKKLGDHLIVALNSDASVKKIKGKSRPIVGEKERATVIAALESVDFVVIFNETTPLSLIEKLTPDVLVKGSDWKQGKIVGADHVIRCGGKVKSAKFIQGCSTTQLIKKIVKKSSN
ncbi:MAG: D-glycero-beta-D-manno-heptose 1-phosphate adenylyltransferase [PVC group bacterium]|nr:D-glycero-beta-D-manno-heptose 1-phosphate adenylyltransferase [PVC group bacterium]